MTSTNVPKRTSDASGDRTRYLTDLQWHIGVYLIINLFFWFLDLGLGQDGAQWAHWISLVWGVALAFHALGWFVDGRRRPG